MKVYFDFNQVSLPGTVVTLGNFDGFHLGHQRILQETKAQAHLHGLPALVMTFHPHPKRLFGASLPLITPLGVKLGLLKKAEADIVLVQPFNRDFADLTPRQFVQDVLRDALACKQVVVGYDYSFGRWGAGDTALLGQMTRSLGMGCLVIPPVRCEGEVVSSSAVRSSLAAGKVELASKYLGRAYTLKGRVSRGSGRGKTLGFPTANIYPSSLAALPAFGVYLVRVCAEGRYYWGVANLGKRPTFPGGKVALEVFLFDYRGDLYDSRLEVGFARRLRSEIKFTDGESLRRQQLEDVKGAKTLLARDNVLRLFRI